MPKDSLRLLYMYLWTDIHTLLLTSRPYYISNWHSRSCYIKLLNHWRILSYFVFPPLFLRVSAALTVTNNFSACLFDFWVGQTNPGTFGAALTSCRSGHSGSSMPLFCSISDSSSAAQSTSLSIGSCKSRFQFSQSSVSGMLWGALSLWLSTGWWLILRIRRTFKIWVCPPGRSFADKGGGKGELSDNLNAAAQSCWKRDQDALTICSMSETYPTAVICLIWPQDSFSLARRFWLPCHISKKLWTFGHSVQYPFLRLFLHFRVVFCVHGIQFWVSACQNPSVGTSKLPYNDFLAKGLAFCYWLPPSKNISAKGKTGLHTDTM